MIRHSQQRAQDHTDCISKERQRSLGPACLVEVRRMSPFVVVACLAALASRVEARTLAYVTNNSQAGFVSVIDVATLSTITTVGISDGTESTGASAIAVAPDGTYAYVLGDTDLHILDTSTNTVVGEMRLTGSGIAFTPDGRQAYIAGCGSSGVCVVDTASRTITAVLGTTGGWLSVSPDGKSVYVSSGDELSVIDTASHRLASSIAIGRPATAIAITPDGTRAYLATGPFAIDVPSTVSVVDLEAQRVIATVPVGSSPAAIAITSDGGRAYVTNHFGTTCRVEPFDECVSTVSVIDTATNVVTATVFLGDITEPLGIAITPDDTQAFVAELEGGVAVVDLATNAVVADVVVGDGPNSVAIAEVPAPSMMTPTTSPVSTSTTPAPAHGGDGACAISPVRGSDPWNALIIALFPAASFLWRHVCSSTVRAHERIRR